MIFHCPIFTSSGINIIIIIIIIIKVMGECVMVKGLYEGDGMVWKGDMMSVHLMESCVKVKGLCVGGTGWCVKVMGGCVKVKGCRMKVMVKGVKVMMGWFV